MPPIRFVDAARVCGVAGWCVADPAGVRGALGAALAHDGPSLVEIVVDGLEAPFRRRGFRPLEGGTPPA